jgi:Mce-associated membrane protein
VSDPQPREQQPQPQPPHQNRTRNRLSADIQTSRRPRAVAGQRAAAKRAGQSPPRPRPAQDDETPASSATTTALVDVPEHIEPKPEREPAASPSTPASAPLAAPESSPSTAATAAPESRKPKPTPRPRSTTRRAIVTAILAVVTLAVLVTAAILGLQYRDATRTDDARTAAMAAAEKAAPVIFSYDYRHLDQDFAKAEAFLTGSFRDQYTKTTQTVVKPTALQYQGVVQAVVAKPADGGAPAVSVVSASPDQVVVLAFIDQSTTSTRVNGTQVDQNRVLLTLTNTPHGWLVSAVDAL